MSQRFYFLRCRRQQKRQHRGFSVLSEHRSHYSSLERSTRSRSSLAVVVHHQLLRNQSRRPRPTCRKSRYHSRDKTAPSRRRSEPFYFKGLHSMNTFESKSHRAYINSSKAPLSTIRDSKGAKGSSTPLFDCTRFQQSLSVRCSYVRYRSLNMDIRKLPTVFDHLTDGVYVTLGTTSNL